MLARHLQDVFTVDEIFIGGGVATLLRQVIGIHSLDIGDNDKDAAREHKQK